MITCSLQSLVLLNHSHILLSKLFNSYSISFILINKPFYSSSGFPIFLLIVVICICNHSRGCGSILPMSLMYTSRKSDQTVISGLSNWTLVDQKLIVWHIKSFPMLMTAGASRTRLRNSPGWIVYRWRRNVSGKLRLVRRYYSRIGNCNVTRMWRPRHHKVLIIKVIRCQHLRSGRAFEIFRYHSLSCSSAATSAWSAAAHWRHLELPSVSTCAHSPISLRILLLMKGTIVHNRHWLAIIVIY